MDINIELANIAVSTELDTTEIAMNVFVNTFDAINGQVQSDYAQTNPAATSYIKNKPENLVQDADYVHTDNNLTDELVSEIGSAVQPSELPNFGDIVTHDADEFATEAQGAKADTALQSYTETDPLSLHTTVKITTINVESAVDLKHPQGSDLQDLTPYETIVDNNIKLGLKADLVDGLVPSTQLPSYVDDVIEVADFAALPITGVSGKIYVTLDDNKTYRWGGTAYVVISETLALGETSATAYRGDRGKTAYDHSQTAHAPSDAEKNIIVGVQKNGIDLVPDVNRKVNVNQ